MSAPLSGAGGPAPGFYPDPSIPGYIRYWNGSSWVPGTSRPEPGEGEPMPSPPTAEAASSAISAAPPASRAEPAPTEETGPVFLDEDNAGHDTGADEAGSPVPVARSGGSLPEVRPRGEVAQASAEPLDWDDPSRLHGRRPEPASAWQADASRQAGFAGQSEERVSWGRGESEVPSAGGTSGTSGADPRGGWGRSVDEGPTGGDQAGGGSGTRREDGESGGGAQSAGGAAPGAVPDAAQPSVPDAAQPPVPDGTFQMRAMSAEDLRNAARARRGSAAAAPSPDHTVGLRRSDVAAQRRDSQAAQPAPAVPAQPQTPSQPLAQPQTPSQPPAQPQTPSQPPAQQAHASAPAQVPPQQGSPGVPQSPQQPSWAQQVQDLAGRNQVPGGEVPGAHVPGGPFGPQGGAEPVTPWRPPVSDPFLRAAQQEARPAALGKRFGARVVDGLLTSAVAAGVGFFFTGQAVDHIEGKIEAVRLAGRTEQVWLIDGTTGGYLAVVLGALVLFGLLYEVLPTCRWGRTLGKKLFGLRVLTMEQQDKPDFRSACLRWLVHGALSVLVVGVVNVLWCLFDRPWRQCWHDKVAGTFVSKDSGEIRL
ncbi:RDD family protein [Streptomyces ovatisporus]|uniref:RDD family protein n=1 Tax=Streptomyces ovatisporus TaxID=1128682 RepID=A0ABV9AJ48_9ACTN